MSPDQHASRKCRNPSCSPNFLSGDQARGTREIVTSRTSPRTLLLHIPLTDPLRRIYRLADSRSGTLESPAGRFFDPSVVGSITTAPPPLSLLVCPSISCLCPDYCLSPRCLHSTAVVHSLEHFAHAERSGLITHQRFRLGSLIFFSLFVIFLCLLFFLFCIWVAGVRMFCLPYPVCVFFT